MNNDDSTVYPTIKWDLAAPETEDATAWFPAVTATSGPAYSIRGKFRSSGSWHLLPAEPAFKYGDIVHHKDFPGRRDMVLKRVTLSDRRIYLDTVILDDEKAEWQWQPSGMLEQDARMVTG